MGAIGIQGKAAGGAACLRENDAESRIFGLILERGWETLELTVTDMKEKGSILSKKDTEVRIGVISLPSWWVPEPGTLKDGLAAQLLTGCDRQSQHPGSPTATEVLLLSSPALGDPHAGLLHSLQTHLLPPPLRRAPLPCQCNTQQAKSDPCRVPTAMRRLKANRRHAVGFVLLVA